MSNTKTHWGVLALVTLIVLLFVVPPLPKPKARPQRINTVNHLWSASIILSRTNTPPAATPNK